MLRGSNQSGSSLQVKRFAIAAGLGCAVALGVASVALAQEDTQAPSAPIDPQEAAPHAGAARAAEKAEPGKGPAPAGKIAPGTVSDEEVERQAEALSRSMMSPFCPGRTLSACPSPNALAWREDIRKWVREGVPANEIRDRLTARHPEHNLTGSPPTYAKWALIGVGLLSVVVLIAALRYLLKPPPPPTAKKDSAAPPGDDKDWDAKLKQELDALDQ